MDAIQSATSAASAFLGKSREFGTVEVGKDADLLLLDADPLADIHNTQRIAGVVLDGKYLSREELDRMLRQVEAAAQRQ
jgi:imidazolonepropionase-like amidohydrolase